MSPASGTPERETAARFCPRCGGATVRRPEGGRERACCPACGHVAFGRFSVGVGGLLVHQGRVLLVQRAHEPGRGRWTLPGGYAEEDEPPDAAVVREIREETGLRVTAAELLAVRHAQMSDQQNAYYVYRVRLAGQIEDLEADGVEVAQARLVEPERLGALGEVGAISRWVVERCAAAGGLRRVPAAELPPPAPGQRWMALYAGLGADGGFDPAIP